jgi:hypothetical protein
MLPIELSAAPAIECSVVAAWLRNERTDSAMAQKFRDAQKISSLINPLRRLKKSPSWVLRSLVRRMPGGAD